MLILARKTNESIMIGDDVQITVIQIIGGVVKLGITADRSIPVHRQEVYEDMKRIARREQLQALSWMDEPLFPKNGDPNPCWVAGLDSIAFVRWNGNIWLIDGIGPLDGRRISPIVKPSECN